MNKAPKHLQEDINIGWSIQIYSHDRRLLCSLYPSHGWVFLFGITLGVLVTLLGLSGHLHIHPASSTPTPSEAPLDVD